MSNFSKEPKNNWNMVLYVLAVTAGILTGDVLLFAPENSKGNCLSAVAIALAIIGVLLAVRKSWIGAVSCLAVCLFVFATVLWYVYHPAPDLTEPQHPDSNIPESVDTDVASRDPQPPYPGIPESADTSTADPVGGAASVPIEVTPTLDGMNLLAFDEMEENPTADNHSYLPELEIQDYRHLFLSFTEEFSSGDTAGTESYRNYILNNCENWDIESLKNFIECQFQDSYQTVEDYPFQTANRSREIAKYNKRLDELEEEIHQARAANEPVLPLYDEFAGIYLSIIDVASRGEYYIQLARAYEEGILYMMRSKPAEKNAVLQHAANAIAYFRTALTYQDPIGDTVPDVFYRIAKIYHYIGDTPDLRPDIRAYFYRIAVAYLTLAAELETRRDTYYGYYSYYCAMVYHKLAIITSAPKAKLEYLELVETHYRSADELYQLDNTAKVEIKHALLDIETRRQQLD